MSVLQGVYEAKEARVTAVGSGIDSAAPLTGVSFWQTGKHFVDTDLVLLLLFCWVGAVPSVRTSRGTSCSSFSTHSGEALMAQSQHATSSFHKPLPYLSRGQIKAICDAGESHIPEQVSRCFGVGAN